MYEFHDSHVHLTNYVQEGTDPSHFLSVMGDRVGRAVLFGIPLQQQWVHRLSGERPSYYFDSAAPLYYYSFTDAHMAVLYRALAPDEQARFDPMITGFNPSDMYGADHIRRVLQLFPGVFSGIGEFTIHKEFVTSKVVGEIASLGDPALDRIFDFAAEVGLVVLIHIDMDTPFAAEDGQPAHLEKAKQLFRRHPGTTTIWAHVGVGRVVRPLLNHLVLLEEILADPDYAHVHFDISWSEVAKYLELTPTTIEHSAALIARYPDRFLFGTDEVAPTDPATYFHVYDLFRPLLGALAPPARDALLKGNYERLFDRARADVRAWEHAHTAG
jgi:hypothetical protein